MRQCPSAASCCIFKNLQAPRMVPTLYESHLHQLAPSAHHFCSLFKSRLGTRVFSCRASLPPLHRQFFSSDASPPYLSQTSCLCLKHAVYCSTVCFVCACAKVHPSTTGLKGASPFSRTELPSNLSYVCITREGKHVLYPSPKSRSCRYACAGKLGADQSQVSKI